MHDNDYILCKISRIMVKDAYVSPALLAVIPGSLLVDSMRYTIKMEKAEAEVAKVGGQERKSEMGAAIVRGTLQGLFWETATCGLLGYLLYKFSQVDGEQSLPIGIAATALAVGRIATNRYLARGREFSERSMERARELEHLARKASTR